MGSHSQLGKHAIVLGGGIAGLLTARVLTEHFERVSLVERDRYPEGPVFRPGVPQGRHIHMLLARGQQIIEELFPGIQHDLVTRGAIEGDWMKDFCFHSRFGWSPRLPSPLRAYATTRVLLEWQIRQALVKNPQIHIIDGHEVVNVVASEDTRSVIGVSLRGCRSFFCVGGVARGRQKRENEEGTRPVLCKNGQRHYVSKICDFLTWIENKNKRGKQWQKRTV